MRASRGAIGPADEASFPARDGALDADRFGQLEDRNTKDDAVLIRQTLAPLREAGIWLL
jgi:hypothetical protein